MASKRLSELTSAPQSDEKHSDGRIYHRGTKPRIRGLYSTCRTQVQLKETRTWKSQSLTTTN